MNDRLAMNVHLSLDPDSKELYLDSERMRPGGRHGVRGTAPQGPTGRYVRRPDLSASWSRWAKAGTNST